MEDRSGHTLDQIGHIPDYPNVVLNSLNRDETLNRLNGLPVNQRGLMNEEISASSFIPYNGSPGIAAEFEHRLETDTHDLDSDMKSFYYTQSLNNVDNMELTSENLKEPIKQEIDFFQCDEDEGIRLSDHGSDRDSESGTSHLFMVLNYTHRFM